MWLNITDVQKAVSAYTEVHERSLNAGLKIYDLSFIDVTDKIFLAGTFDIEFL